MGIAVSELSTPSCEVQGLVLKPHSAAAALQPPVCLGKSHGALLPASNITSNQQSEANKAYITLSIYLPFTEPKLLDLFPRLIVCSFSDTLSII